MFQNEFNMMINQFGVPVILNLETVPRKAIISSITKSPDLYDFDDKRLHTNFLVKRGDTIKVNDTIFLVFSDVQLKSGYKYESIIRPATNTIPFIVQEEIREII